MESGRASFLLFWCGYEVPLAKMKMVVIREERAERREESTGG